MKTIKKSDITVPMRDGVVAGGQALPSHQRALKVRTLTIFVRRLEIEAALGVYTCERAHPQPVVLDLEYTIADTRACLTDQLNDTVDYAGLVDFIRKKALEKHYDLVEYLAYSLAESLCQEFALVSVRLCLAKVNPFPGAEVGAIVDVTS